MDFDPSPREIRAKTGTWLTAGRVGHGPAAALGAGVSQQVHLCLCGFKDALGVSRCACGIQACLGS
jgi:hypothetical protein